MTSDIEFLLDLGVPISIIAERASRSVTAISYELEGLHQQTPTADKPQPRQRPLPVTPAHGPSSKIRGSRAEPKPHPTKDKP